MPSRQLLEKNQVVVYTAAILLGLLLGFSSPSVAGLLEKALWPVLAVLIYSTFTQVPLTHLRDAFTEPRFLLAAMLGNFVLIPVFVWLLLPLAPADPALQLGVLLVLLVPCTDWFITFSQLGRGDTKRAIAFSPLSLLLQIVLLPFYLWLFVDGTLDVSDARDELLAAFAGLILLPLAAAWITERWADRSPQGATAVAGLAWLPVPLLAMVVFVIAASQVNLVMGSAGLLLHLLAIFTIFLLFTALAARLMATLFRLPADQGRVLAFSFGTRNSFVVLPLALALPGSMELAVVAVVFQSLVELVGMIFYLWWVPGRLFPER